MKRSILLLLTIIATSAVQVEANPLTFQNVSALQNGGNTSVDLFSNPGTTLLGTQLTFTVEIIGTLGTGQSDTLVATYADATGASITQSFGIPLLGTVHPPLTLLITFSVPHASFAGVPATLTLDLLSSNPDFVIPTTEMAVNSQTYSFNVAEPVPEPSALMLLGGGLAGLMTVMRRGICKAKEAAAQKRNSL